jgi:nitrogen PTS system EIIA component
VQHSLKTCEALHKYAVSLGPRWQAAARLRSEGRQSAVSLTGPLYKHGSVGDHIRMPYSDFDLMGLARYLHLSPDKVAKLADRGQLPGRKVGGEWKFSKSDIHHWLERRIGASDEGELLEVEGVLDAAAPTPQEQEISIAELLPLEAIAVPLPARTRSSVIDSMVKLAAQTGWLWDTDAMAEAIRSREELHTTALENGVALLHPRRPLPKLLAQEFVALGVTSTGIPFGPDVPMTGIFFLIASTEDRGHLRTLARLSRILAVPGFIDSLRTAADARAARQLFVEAEEKL